jgi:hypothetical protein
MQVQLTIRVNCGYEEFLGALVPVFDQAARQPWNFQKDLLVHGKPFYRSTLRRFLCPGALGPGDFQALCAIHAGPDSNLDDVLHELIWYDWFKDLPISQILSQGVPYVIVITPGNLLPWTLSGDGHKYRDKLRKRGVAVGPVPGFRLPLDEAPIHLALDMGRSMALYESETDLGMWFRAHTRPILDRRILWDKYRLARLEPEDYQIFKANATEVTRIALQCSPV